MPSYRYVFILLMPLAVQACAGSDKAPAQSERTSLTAGTDSASRQTEGSSQTLPENWQALTYSEWLDALELASCEAENQGSEARRKSWVRLDESSQLLLLTCDFGAYQDAFHVYTVNIEDKAVIPVTLQTPSEEADPEGEPLVRGTLYKGDQGNVVNLLYLSAATGACGWRTMYSMADVKRGGSVQPEKVFGDDDCYNDVTVEKWSRIE